MLVGCGDDADPATQRAILLDPTHSAWQEHAPEVFTAIVKHVGNDPALRTQTVEMFRLMLSLDYGNDDARNRARAYLEKHGPTKPPDNKKSGVKKGRIF